MSATSPEGVVIRPPFELQCKLGMFVDLSDRAIEEILALMLGTPECSILVEEGVVDANTESAEELVRGFEPEGHYEEAERLRETAEDWEIPRVISDPELTEFGKEVCRVCATIRKREIEAEEMLQRESSEE
jgi:hypothetical protein